MKFIKILPDGLIDRIAAGEVIENPASVIKELIENSLDAGASNIEVSISGGGKDEILIVDDGDGIPKDQVEIAFMRHATSKIKSWDDLLKTSSMGFRGEALPSISSVAIFELQTCYKDEKIGSLIRYEGGKQVHFGPAPPKKGCSFSVRNLFYNVPARRKFLKSDNSEQRKILDILRRYIIARPDVGFKYIKDGKQIFSYPAQDDYFKRLESLWGPKIAKGLLKIAYEQKGPVDVFGYVSDTETMRGNRSEIYFFVNRRPVIEKAMFSAVSAAYANLLPPGRFPYAAIFLDIEPTFIDINVHPAKIEIRFSDDRFIFSTIKNALDRTIASPVGFQLKHPERFKSSDNVISFEQAKRELFGSKTDNSSPSEPIISGETVSEETPPEAIINPEFYGPFLQLLDTYIVFRADSELLILDQHTAHERILFEKNLKSFESNATSSQKMLFEERVKLTPSEFEIFEEVAPLLEKAGFELRSFGVTEVLISGVPPELSKQNPGNALKGFFKDYLGYRKDGLEVKRAVAAAVACKAAVKAGQRLTDAQMRGLYIDLLKCNEPYRCPLGRPTIAKMNKDDLERVFKRK